MRHVVFAVIVGIGAAFAGCGPSAQEVQEVRICEMYADAGGSKEDLARWVKHFNEPEEVAKIEAGNASQAALDAAISRVENQRPDLVKLRRDICPECGKPRPPQTPQSKAEQYFAYDREMNEKAKASVSARLSISMREVNEALEKCEKAKKRK